MGSIWDDLSSTARKAIASTGSAIHDAGATISSNARHLYDSTLGPTGAALREVPANVIGGAGQAYNDVVGGIKGAYAGTGQVLNRTGNAGANVVEQVPVIVRDLTVPTGQAIGDVGAGLKGIGQGAGGALDKTGSGLKLAGLGIGALVVVILVAVLVFAFKNPRTAAAAVAR